MGRVARFGELNTKKLLGVLCVLPKALIFENYIGFEKVCCPVVLSFNPLSYLIYVKNKNIYKKFKRGVKRQDDRTPISITHPRTVHLATATSAEESTTKNKQSSLQSMGYTSPHAFL
ncbi:hypothetical protein [Xylella fastidiosa]|uniref:hypothetical protein n=1 Tax=Xylella fastidiosa TaxID=2371 RepID=UPI001386ECF0|nr:hypothetical protein [Xylella fastidiosa]TNW21563.1 hypothetical protein EIP73_00040 [Xylella fastidiosa subsp. pauca]